MRKLLAFVAVLAALGSTAFVARRGLAARRAAGRNVLLVTIDTLRADALGCYGNRRAETPTLDRLAHDGVRFEAAHAQSVLTLPSHASILSGRYPIDHGIRDNAGFRFPSDVDTLATILKARGYHTGAFVSAFPLDARFGLARGFDVYDDRLGGSQEQAGFKISERTGPETVALARRFIEAQGDEPFFVWVHVYEPHFPYAPPPPLAARFTDAPYLGDVSAADAALAPLLQPFLDAGARGRTLVVVTADHGESLGEHGERTHGLFAYEATLRVPLMLFAPQLLAPRVVSEPVRHVDLLPTILDLLALPIPAALPGRTLLRPAESGPDTSYFEALAASRNRGWAPLRGILRGRLKYIELPIPELYDLATDPGETRNLAAERPAETLRMARALAALQERKERKPPLVEAPEVRERLGSLGYLSGPSPNAPSSYDEADDPKRLVELDAALQEVVGAYERGDLAGAIAGCRDVVRRRPRMPVALLQLAFLERQAGDLPSAVRAARAALELRPDDAETLALLGTYLNESGQAEEAVRLIGPSVNAGLDDLDALTALGVALAQTGRGGEALAVFERARQVAPGDALTLVNVATVQLMARDYASARAQLEAAIALDPALTRAYNTLGVIEAETGHRDAAIARWKQALERDPHELDALFNLGDLLRQQQRAAEARPYLERFVNEAPRALRGRDIARARAWIEGAS